MTEQNETKREKTQQNPTETFSVRIIITLSDEEQINAAKSKATAYNAGNPDKLVAIGNPSKTAKGLEVEFGVKP